MPNEVENGHGSCRLGVEKVNVSRVFYTKGGLHLGTPRDDLPAQELKYAKAVRAAPRRGWAVVAVLRVPVAAPAGSVRSCATTGR